MWSQFSLVHPDCYFILPYSYVWFFFFSSTLDLASLFLYFVGDPLFAFLRYSRVTLLFNYVAMSRSAERKRVTVYGEVSRMYLLFFHFVIYLSCEIRDKSPLSRLPSVRRTSESEFHLFFFPYNRVTSCMGQEE